MEINACDQPRCFNKLGLSAKIYSFLYTFSCLKLPKHSYKSFTVFVLNAIIWQVMAESSANLTELLAGNSTEAFWWQ